MDYDKKISQTILMMESMARGIDPTSDIPFPDDTILNNHVIKKCFIDTAEILNGLLADVHRKKTGKKDIKANIKQQFYFSINDKKNVTISSTPISISKFAHTINSTVENTNMKKIRAMQITRWLTDNGYLSIIGAETETQYKVTTAKGIELGISTVRKVNSIGEEYATNFYSSDAQKYILTNINSMAFY